MTTADVIIVCALIAYFREAILEIYDEALGDRDWDAVTSTCEFVLSKFDQELDVDLP